MSLTETIERTVTETKHGWSVQLRFADHPDFDAAKNAILIRADVVDVREAHPRVREVLRVALQSAQVIINREIASLESGQPLKP
jgi:hypothetical protein